MKQAQIVAAQVLAMQDERVVIFTSIKTKADGNINAKVVFILIF